MIYINSYDCIVVHADFAMGTGHFLLHMDFAIQKLYIAAAGRMHCKIILRHVF